MPKINKKDILYGVLIAFALLVLAGIPFVLSRTLAVCGALPSDKGQATYSVNVPSNGTYRGWVRMLSPAANDDSIYMQVDDSYCSIAVGDTSLPAGSFKWVNYHGGNTSNLLTFALTAGTHTVKIAGKDPNVGVDRIMFVSDLTCTPTGTGDNCLSASPPPPPPPPTAPTVTLSGITNGATVSGNLVIEAKPQGSATVEKIDFYLDNALVRTERNGPYCFGGDDGTCFAWDSRSVGNGSHSIKAVMTYQGGTAQVINSFTVSNSAAPDTTPPGAPSNVKATATSAAEVKVTWSAAADNSGGRGVSFYRVYRNGSNTPLGTANITSFTDTTVTANQTYTYRVSAVDGAGNEGAKSANASATTPITSDTTAPSTPKNLRVTTTTSGKIEIAWDPSTDNKGLAGYHVYRGGQLIASPKGTSFSDANLAPDTTYKYAVDAYDTSGNKSSKTPELSVKTHALVNVGGNNPTTPLTGTVSLKPATQKPVASVEYSVDGKPIEGDTLDTSKLSDGEHTIAATVRYEDGTTETLTSKVTTSNTWEFIKSGLTSGIFWMWVGGGTAVVGVGVLLARKLYINRPL